MSKGFVYILSNPAFPSLLKIGSSAKVPTERIVELFTTGVPEPFCIEYYCLVDNCEELEAKIHSVLSRYRVRDDREFFRVDLPFAIRTIGAHGRIEHRWSRSGPYRPPPRSFSPVRSSDDERPERRCHNCGTVYYYALYCPKCQTKLA